MVGAKKSTGTRDNPYKFVNQNSKHFKRMDESPAITNDGAFKHFYGLFDERNLERHSKTKQKQDFPAMYFLELMEYLDKFANVPKNVAIMPFGKFQYILSPKQKQPSGKFRYPQRWQRPNDPESIERLRKLCKTADHVIFPIIFRSYHKQLPKQNSHIVTLHVNKRARTISYFCPNLLDLNSKGLQEYKRFRIIQRESNKLMRLYDLPQVSIQPIFSTHGSQRGLEKGCLLYFLCIIEQLTKQNETKFPKKREVRVKAGEVMKCLEIGTPNFLEKDEMKEWRKQGWGECRI